MSTAAPLHAEASLYAAGLSVFSIPELLNIISSQLNASSISSCALSSRRMNTLFTPLLWYNISIKTRAQERCFVTEEVMAALRRNIKYIRTIDTGSKLVLLMLDTASTSAASESASPVLFTNLTTMNLHWWGPDVHHPFFNSPHIYSPDWDQSAICLISKSPNLTSVDLDLSVLNQPNLPLCLKAPRNLQKLHISGFRKSETYSRNVAMLLDSLPEQVQDLTLDMELNSEVDDLLPIPPYIQGQICHSSIKKIALNGSLLALPDAVLFRILDHCQGLKTLLLMHPLTRGDVAATVLKFQMACGELDELEIEASNSSLRDEKIADIIVGPPPVPVPEPVPNTPVATAAASSASSTASSPAPTASSRYHRYIWKSIAIDAPDFGPAASSAILHHAATLERIALEERGLQENDLRTLLATAPNLKMLTSLNVKGPKYNDCFLKPSLATELPWVCMESLVELRLALRPGRATTSAREALMTRLGDLVQLKILHLQNGVKKSGGFTDFSLSNGELERLGGLRNLEVFELEHFKHRVGEQELVWMYAHWPKLKRVCIDCERNHHEVAKVKKTLAWWS
ncbi:hypothetical protein BGX28_001171 [Mortierella sp. GBA30]|nr:hypothetical protein BGX28_001171 [Mortierella sp. GBA30]